MSWAKITYRGARDMISVSLLRFLRTTSSIAPFSTPPGVIFKVKRSFYKIQLVNFVNFARLFVCV